jgi:hypothetical protein
MKKRLQNFLNRVKAHLEEYGGAAAYAIHR